MSYHELRFLKGPREGERVALEEACANEDDDEPDTVGDHSIVILGRSPLANVKIEDRSLSRRHCMLKVTDRGVGIADLGSKNGTYVNGRKLESKRRLRGGDRITIGSSLIEFHCDEDFLDQPKVCVSCGREISLETFVDRSVQQEDEGKVFVCPQCRSGKELPEVEGFEVKEKLGTGNLGTVYRARHEAMRRNVALKLLHPRLAHDETNVKRFFREAGSAGGLNHKNIVQVYGADETGNTCYISMELVEGPSLGDLIEERERLPEPLVVSIGRQLADALHAAYQEGIVHRDIKPDNILLAGGETPKIADFGLAKSFETAGMSGLTSEGASLGTLAYLPPEQLDDAVYADQRSDIYALGATLYHALTGQPPFQAKSPRGYFGKIIQETPIPPSERVPEISSEMDRIVLRCLEKEKEDRYQEPAELRDELKKLG